MKKYTFIYKTLFLLLLPSFLFAQKKDTRWKKERYELLIGTGISTYMGDLGGGAGDALHFLGAGDLDASLVMPIAQIGARFKVLERLAIRTNLAFTYIKGDDAKSQDKGRYSRNLSFRSPISEASMQLEFSIIKERITKQRPSRRRRAKFPNINVYIFAGIGGFYFNPQAQLRDSKTNILEWHDLQPLGTEGQGIADNPAKYKLFETCYPVGLGIKIPMGNSAINLEGGLRYTTTDYLDDVSNMYYDNNEIRLAYGDVAANLADRHFDEDGTPSDYKYPTATPIRGNPDFNDVYFFFTISYVYRISSTRRGRPTPKFRKNKGLNLWD